MCGHCNAEDARVCEECGALIAFEWQPEHKAFHEVVTALSLAALNRIKSASDEEPG